MIQFMVSYPGLDPATTDIDKLKRALIYAASTLRYPLEHALGPYHNYHGVVVQEQANSDEIVATPSVIIKERNHDGSYTEVEPVGNVTFNIDTGDWTDFKPVRAVGFPTDGSEPFEIPVSDHDKIVCSFCGDDETKYKKVMAGPDNLYICDACIALAASWCCCPEFVHSDDAFDEFDFVRLTVPVSACPIPFGPEVITLMAGTIGTIVSKYDLNAFMVEFGGTRPALARVFVDQMERVSDEEPAGTFPSGLNAEELSEWIRKRYEDGDSLTANGVVDYMKRLTIEDGLAPKDETE